MLDGASTMATALSTMPLQRPKKVVRYGRTSSRSTYNTQNIDSWLEDDPPIVKPMANAEKQAATDEILAQKSGTTPDSTISRTAGVRKMGKRAEPDKGALKPAKSRPKSQDTFEIPSSEDEDGMACELKTYSPARFKSRRLLVDTTGSNNVALAPWEKNQPGNTKTSSRGTSPQKPAVANSEAGRKITQPMQKTKSKARLDVAVSSGPELSSAAARLAARRLQSKSPTHSDNNKLARPALGSAKRATCDDRAGMSPLKRVRRLHPSELECGDVSMDGGNIVPARDSSRNEEISNNLPANPLNDGDNVVTPNLGIGQYDVRTARTSPPVSAPRSRPKKSIPAPAHLAEIFPIDTDSTDAPSQSPSVLASRSSTPNRPGTPSRNDSSPRSTCRAALGMTPKQAQLWSQLLPDGPLAPTPSSLAMQNLTLEGRRHSHKRVAMKNLWMPNSTSDVPQVHRRRTRLVDRLKASAESSSEELDGESDVHLEDIGSPEVVLKKQTGTHEIFTNVDLSSQSQNQSIASEAGAKVTYAKMRSYLPEDSLEEGLMVDLPSLTSQLHSTLLKEKSNTHTASQKSAFDSYDSEDDGTAGRMRTVHELRAAGRMDRFLRDTEALLEEISDHGISARGRRRSAFMDLAVKLTDKGYVERFLGQGFEQKLLVECAAPPDEVADAALAATFAIFLASEPPQHVIFSLMERDLLGWASKQLHHTNSLVKMAKDRRNNMSKVAQDGVFHFADKLKSQSGLWEKSVPTDICPRLLALSVLDQLIGCQRRLGDRSELLDNNQIMSITYRFGVDDLDSAETILAISVLESLSTSALTLAWPKEVVETIATATSKFIDHPSDSYPARHALFLAFRLTLNLTNANVRNCALMSSSELVSHLIRAVQNGFTVLEQDAETGLLETERRAVDLDLLILSMGIMINLAEHSAEVRKQAASINRNDPASTLSAIVRIFQQGQQRVEEAESVEESVKNVAFGYLSIMLANLCLDPSARKIVAGGLPGKNLGLLVAAVEEFVRHHQQVDMLGALEGGEGREVQGAFTEKLKEVLKRLREVAKV